MVESEEQESVGSRHRDEFANLEHRRDRALAHSPSIKAKPVHPNHISRIHFVSSRNVPRDQEMHDLRVEVHHLRQRLRQRVHIKESRSRSPSPSSSSVDEQGYKWRTRSLRVEIHKTPFHSVGGERHLHRRHRTPPSRS